MLALSPRGRYLPLPQRLLTLVLVTCVLFTSVVAPRPSIQLGSVLPQPELPSTPSAPEAKPVVTEPITSALPPDIQHIPESVPAHALGVDASKAPLLSNTADTRVTHTPPPRSTTAPESGLHNSERAQDILPSSAVLNPLQLPLAFQPVNSPGNETRFFAQGIDGTLLFQPQSVLLAVPVTTANQPRMTDPDAITEPVASFASVRLQFQNPNPDTQITAAQPLPGTVNYFIGNRSEQWQTDIPTYGAVVYTDLYPGIDLQYDGNNGRLKGTYTVAPGVAYQQIQWLYEGAEDVRIDQKTGNALIYLPGQRVPIVEHAPIAWQVVDGVQHPVSVGYELTGQQLRFNVGTYNPALPLILDPTITYSSYFGGDANNDPVWDIAIGSDGGMYITGFAASLFPSVSGITPLIDPNVSPTGINLAFIAKIQTVLDPISGDPEPELVYLTYLGGVASSGTTSSIGYGIVVDSSGAAYITGRTDSASFPILNAPSNQNTLQGDFDAFVTKLAASTGTLVYSTYLGGTGVERAFDIAIDSSDAVYVTGYSESQQIGSWPSCASCSAARSAAFVARVTYASSPATITHLATIQGNPGTTGRTEGYGIAVDSAGMIYIVGKQEVAGFTPAHGYDLFVTKLDPDPLGPNGATVVFTRALGGSGDEAVQELNYSTGRRASLAIDDDGGVYVASATASQDLPTTPGVWNATPNGNIDGWVAKLATLDGAIQFVTYLGGQGYDSIRGIAVDSDKRVYVTGRTESTSFFTDRSATIGGRAFVARLDAEGQSLDQVAYLSDPDGRSVGFGIVLSDTSSSTPTIHVAGEVGSESLPNDDATILPYQTTGASDGFLAVIETDLPPVIIPAANQSQSTLSASSTTAAADGIETIQITATLRDSSGTALPNRPVRWVVSGSGNLLQPRASDNCYRVRTWFSTHRCWCVLT